MRRVPMLTAFLVGGTLMLCGVPVPARAQPKPDVLVSIGAVVTEPTFVRVPVTLANATGVSPAPDVYYIVKLTALRGTSQVVCERHVTVQTVPPNSSRLAFHFRLGYPESGKHVLEPGIAKSVKYRLIARATPSQLCPNVDSNCVNNTVTREFNFPPGGTPLCIKLL